jgi:hypothetical protein
MTSTGDALDDGRQFVVDFRDGPGELVGEVRSELIEVRETPCERLVGRVDLGSEVGGSLIEDR